VDLLPPLLYKQGKKITLKSQFKQKMITFAAPMNNGFAADIHVQTLEQMKLSLIF